ncbi:hypothetical protein PL263_17900 [Methylomonas sp. EFPC3]|uniref:hypothetical protein n=1 Tax=Methylomonas sp. EFPC3 TaxID=3021710 RepID=UPI002417BF8B|nr:hypothetical protein [Methylomonas sp. EFPC3]WFP48488.1 hypothetical protein PL263_10215 [Methylomonas sp. EFPC3]WFP49961.1 hypothetical protein PL263_17900 [Methylomonas sp. EFPC3]
MYIEITRKSIAFGFGAIPSINDSGEVPLMLDTTTKVLFLGNHEFYLEVHPKGTDLQLQRTVHGPREVSFHWHRFSFHYTDMAAQRARRTDVVGELA